MLKGKIKDNLGWADTTQPAMATLNRLQTKSNKHFFDGRGKQDHETDAYFESFVIFHHGREGPLAGNHWQESP